MARAVTCGAPLRCTSRRSLLKPVVPTDSFFFFCRIVKIIDGRGFCGGASQTAARARILPRDITPQGPRVRRRACQRPPSQGPSVAAASLRASPVRRKRGTASPASGPASRSEITLKSHMSSLNYIQHRVYHIKYNMIQRFKQADGWSCLRTTRWPCGRMVAEKSKPAPTDRSVVGATTPTGSTSSEGPPGAQGMFKQSTARGRRDRRTTRHRRRNPGFRACPSALPRPRQRSRAGASRVALLRGLRPVGVLAHRRPDEVVRTPNGKHVCDNMF
jgi:hypothetical protein